MDGDAAATPCYAQVVVEVAPDHLDRPFDYRVPDGEHVAVGQRVRVVFAGRRRTGWVVGVSDTPSTDPARIRPLSLLQGERTWFDADDLPLWRWVADRYCAPLASVLRHALPARVAAVEAEAADWGPPPPVAPALRPPCPSPAWRAYQGATADGSAAGSRLLRAATRPSGEAFSWRLLAGHDRTAPVVDLVARCLAAGRSALVLAAAPSSPLLDAALAVAGPDAGADLRAGGSERDRYRAFLRCRTGHARVAVGERGAVFAPLRDLGLIVVDDEANPAYKERRSPRHHAREVALARGRLGGATTVLLADLPSAQTWRLRTAGHVVAVAPDRAAERAGGRPRVDVVDLSDPRPGTRRARLSELANAALREAVRAGRGAAVLAARGGQGSALACRGCGRRLACPVCDGAIRPRRDGDGGLWECAACGWSDAAFACPDCGDTRTSPLAAGAARLAAELARAHPAAEVVRMEGFDAPGPTTRPAIAVMTRGSVVERPGWLGDERAAVVVVPDADAMLGRAALDAAEDALRLWMAVGHWAERLVLQTRDPRHHAVQALVRWDPDGFWEREAGRRAELGYPPSRSLIKLSAPPALAADVAAALRAGLPAADDLLGPDPSGAVLVKSADLRGTLQALTPLRHRWAKADAKVRVDVDPVSA